MTESVLYEQDERIVKITLNRPDTRNALSGDIIEGLVDSLNKADKIIGLARANEMILTCDVLDSQKALDWGLVSKVVTNDELLDEAYRTANKIASQPPEASRRAKRLLRMSQNVSLDKALEMAASQQSILQQLDDHREAIDALLEKRKPNYTNS